MLERARERERGTKRAVFERYRDIELSRERERERERALLDIAAGRNKK